MRTGIGMTRRESMSMYNMLSNTVGAYREVEVKDLTDEELYTYRKNLPLSEIEYDKEQGVLSYLPLPHLEDIFLEMTGGTKEVDKEALFYYLVDNKLKVTVSEYIRINVVDSLTPEIEITLSTLPRNSELSTHFAGWYIKYTIIMFEPDFCTVSVENDILIMPISRKTGNFTTMVNSILTNIETNANLLQLNRTNTSTQTDNS